jgi:hypothetical protein
MLSSVMSRPDGLMGRKRFAQSVSRFGLRHRTHGAVRPIRVGLSNRTQLRVTERNCFRAARSPVDRTDLAAIATAFAAAIIASRVNSA